MTPRIKRLAWHACIAGTIALLGITYSPLILRESVSDPWLFGLPRTLWASLATAFGIVALTAIGAVVLPKEEPLDDNANAGSDHR